MRTEPKRWTKGDRALKTKMMKSTVFTLACMLVLAGSAFASTTVTSPLQVSATVTGVCSISAAPMGFGAYDPLAAAPLPGSALLTILCTNGLPAVVTMDQGLHAAGGSTPAIPLRQMGSGLNVLAYGLFTDNGYLNTWDGVTGSPYTGTGLAGSNLTVYGQVPAGQNVQAGAYTDTVTVSITF
jgi:spore coat protein U-like protein